MPTTAELSVLVVGASGGLARETIGHLIDEGVGRIVMAGRSEARVREARNAVVGSARPGTAVATAGGFDMTDPAAIESAVAALPDEPFDVVFLAAGGVVFGDERQHVTWNGIDVERTVFQNVLGAHVTLSALHRRGLVRRGGRVVFAGGEGARGIPGLIPRPTFASPEELRAHLIGGGIPGQKYHPMYGIGVSKLMGALWVAELAQRDDLDFEISWFSPGLTGGTNGLAGAGRVRRFVLEKFGFPLMQLLGRAQSARAGGRKNADALLGRVGGHGRITGAPEGKAVGDLVDQTPMNPAFTDAALRREFSDVVAKAVGPFGA